MTSTLAHTVNLTPRWDELSDDQRHTINKTINSIASGAGLAAAARNIWAATTHPDPLEQRMADNERRLARLHTIVETLTA